jgi:ubiquinone/menaquinone biosynthesis C-methylase UbiE
MLKDHDQKWNMNPKGYSNFVKASAEHLPFRDNSFIEVYSSHLLEHLDNPDKALAEMKRVSKKTVRIILPFALFQFLDFFYLLTAKKFVEHRQWLKEHHKRNYYFNPLRIGFCKFKFANLKDAILLKKKVYGSLIKIPIPFETETVISK